MAKRYVEDRHQAKLENRVMDIRPASTIYAEWLSEKLNVCIIVFPLLILCVIAPFLSPILLLVAFGHVAVHSGSRVVLPFRYPAGNQQKDHKGKKGTGILLMGDIESDSEYERFKEIWLSDDDLRKHMLIIGSTGSGKSESLKGIFFNSLCWSSGFFIADGKADNKLPTDTFTMVRSFGRDDDLLFLNFLLGGKTPEQVRKSRRRRTNKINPVSSADSDTIIQMGANMLPKVEGEGKNWQEKALNLWRAVIQALCYMRDTDITGIERADLSISTIIDYLAMHKVEELFIIGYKEYLERGEWSHGFNGIKSYLESGCPAYKVEKLLAKHGFGDGVTTPSGPGRPPAAGKAGEQDSMAAEQHAYRTSQLMPVLNLLDKTYGFIFRDKFPEIDMIDSTLNNRILVMLIPSLEKSAQEAENLGKLAIACLRVMMGKNLGSEIEGTRNDLISSKATAANYPYLVALDELAYYFADGIAVMFAQARSLGFCMIAACQDLEKLTEGNRAAEAGAMLANQVAKWFMRIDDAKKTYEFITTILGKISVAVRRTYELGSAGYKRTSEIDVQEVARVSLDELQKKGPGEAVFNNAGKTVRATSFYVGHDMTEHKNEEFFVLRFLQVEPPSVDDIDAHSIPMDKKDDRIEKGSKLLKILRHESARWEQDPEPNAVVLALKSAAESTYKYAKAHERAIALYEAAKLAVISSENASIASSQADPDMPLVEGKQNQHPDDDDEDEDQGIDPLAFMGTPFKRKAAEMLLDRSPRSREDAQASREIVNTETTSMGRPIGLADDEVDPIQVILEGRKYLNLQVETMEAEFAVAEAATMRALSGLPRLADGAEDDLDWVQNAVAEADKVLAIKSSQGKTVVGFSDHTLANVQRIEEILGSPSPNAAASRLEAVVSAQVTPDIDVDPDSSYQSEDIDAFFQQLTNPSQKN